MSSEIYNHLSIELIEVLYGVLFTLVLVVLAHKVAALQRLIKISFLLFWLLVSPGAFFYVAFFTNADKATTVAAIALGCLLWVPWIFIGLPELMKELNLKGLTNKT